jgi:hypothetical protein
MISRCCKKEVYVTLDYYVCIVCHKACDAIDPSLLEKDYYNDTRNQTEAKELIN